MNLSLRQFYIGSWLLLSLGFAALSAQAEPGDDSPYSSDEGPPPPESGYQNGPQGGYNQNNGYNPNNPPPRNLNPRQPPANARDRWDRNRPRKYFVPDHERTDAGIFHVAFVAGGNFYIEPQVNLSTKTATGDYFKDFGFQAGIVFDYDYSALTENVPLGLRGMFGYKYIFSSMHVFGFDGIARYMFRVSDWATFGLGTGVSAAVWYRSLGEGVREEQTLFVPSYIISGGFEFNPFMTELKWVITRLGSDANTMGFELYFGLRL